MTIKQKIVRKLHKLRVVLYMTSWRIYRNLYIQLQPKRNIENLFLLTTFRTGSNFLISNLNSHPCIDFIGDDAEVLRSGGYAEWYTMLSPTSSKKSAIRHIKNTLLSRPKRIAGVKLMFEHLNRYNISVEDLKENFPGSKYILLYRQSVISQYLSNIKAARTGVFTWTNGENKNDELKIFVDINDFQKYYDYNKNNYVNVIENKWDENELIVLSYEELVNNFSNVMREKISPFLNIESTKTYSCLRKQAIKPIEESIQNMHEAHVVLDDKYNLNLDA